MRILPLLAVSLLGAASVDSFPGPPQPDPGTGFSSTRRGLAAAFAASVREAGDRYDPAASPTVFLWDLHDGVLRQITALGPSDQASVAQGIAYVRVGTATEKTRFTRTFVAFRSTADLAAKNADGSAEIFVWDSATGGFTQVTDATAGASSTPVLGARFDLEKDVDGLYTGKILARWRVAFLSTSDLAGDNAAGIPQVFQFDSGAPEVERLVQISHSPGGAASAPAVDGSGTRVAFVHDGVLLPGDGSPEVYAWDRNRGLRRATLQGSTADGAAETVLDATGRFVAWTAGLPGARRIQVADLQKGGLSTFTPTAGDHRSPALGKGRSPLACLSTDPGDGGAPVAERPVELRKDGTFREIGLPGGVYGPMRATRDKRFLFLTSTEDLDGSNAAGREVLYTVRYRP